MIPNPQIFASNQLKSSRNRHASNDPEFVTNRSEFIANRLELYQMLPNRLKLVAIRSGSFRIASKSSSNRRKEANDPPTRK